MSNIRVVPFTEIVERAADLSRSSADVRRRIRGAANEVYTREIPREYDWPWLKTSSAISCVAEYNTGVVTVSTQGTLCTFSGATITASMSGRKIKFSNNANIYKFTYSTSALGTISPPLSGEVNVSTGGYTIFKNIYALPSDFDRWPVNGGLLFYESGQPDPVPERKDDDFYAEANASPTSIPDGCRLIDYDTAGNLQFELIPPPATPYIVDNEYIRLLKPMRETTAGTVTITSGATAVTGVGSKFTQAASGDYLRIDAFGKNEDSNWYRISVITNDTTLTLSTAFRADSSVTTSIYTICSAPEMPPSLHDGIIYGTIRKILPDHKDPMFLAANANYAKILTDNKVLIQSRFAKDDIELLAEDNEYRR